MSRATKDTRMDITPTSIAYRVLKWMQAHEEGMYLKKTTAAKIADTIADMEEEKSGSITIQQTLARMIKTNVLYRYRYDGSTKSDFRINYWHKSIPADILENAPVSIKRAMAKSIENMQPNQYMDDEGCVVTPNAVEKTEDPFSENESVEKPKEDAHEIEENVEYEPDVSEGPIVEEKDHLEEGGKDDVEEGEATIPLQITKEKDGKTTNVTINLTINL